MCLSQIQILFWFLQNLPLVVFHFGAFGQILPHVVHPHHSVAQTFRSHLYLEHIMQLLTQLCTAQNVCPNFNYKIKLYAHNICRFII